MLIVVLLGKVLSQVVLGKSHSFNNSLVNGNVPQFTHPQVGHPSFIAHLHFELHVLVDLHEMRSFDHL